MKRTSIALLALLLVISLSALTGCPKQAEVSSVPEAQPQPEKVDQAPAPPVDEAAKAAEAAREAAAREAAAKAAAGLQPVYFDFDKSFIRDDAKAVMKENADYLKK